MRRIRRWGAFGLFCTIGGLAGWDASASPAARGGGGFAAARPVGAASRSAGFLPVRHAFDRGASGRFGGVDYEAAQGRSRRGDGFRPRTFVSGGYWPPFGDPYVHGDGDYGAPPPVVVLDQQGDPDDPTVLDLPARPGIRAAPAPEPAVFTADRDAWRAPRRPSAKILSRGRDGHFAVVEGSGEAMRGASDAKIIQIGAPERR